jgi:uncharacterized protein (TIRG00374 family)
MEIHNNINNRPIKSGRYLWILLLAVVVYAGLSFSADWHELTTALESMKWVYIPAVLTLASLNYIVRFGKWHYYIRHLGFCVGRIDNLVIFLAGLIMSITPGKMGEVLKSYLLKVLDRTPMCRTAPVVFAERLTDLVALLILTVVGGYALSGAGGALIAGMIIVILILVMVSSESLHGLVLGHLHRFQRIRSFIVKIETSLESARSLVAPRPMILTSAISVPAWFCECIGFWLVLRALGIHELGLLPATGIYALGAVVGALSMLPGGLGATELTLTGLLTASGVPQAKAVAATLIIRAATLWYAVIIGAVFLSIFRYRDTRSSLGSGHHPVEEHP